MIADNPISVGDYCSVDSVTGTVEDIGMRSTRLRTLERTVITIPNGTMSQARIENFASRDSFRFNPFIKLAHDTSADQLREVIWRLRGMLEGDPRIVPDSMLVRFGQFDEGGLSIKLWAQVEADDYAASLAVREDLNFQIMDIIADTGSRIALPTQTILLRGPNEVGQPCATG